jgi:hypothetical protein
MDWAAASIFASAIRDHLFFWLIPAASVGALWLLKLLAGQCWFSLMVVIAMVAHLPYQKFCRP